LAAPKFNASVVGTILDAIRAGKHKTDAANAAGVTSRVLDKWLVASREADVGSDYYGFASAYDAAVLDAKNDRQAAIRERYGRQPATA
jgi:hypothetical protein